MVNNNKDEDENFFYSLDWNELNFIFKIIDLVMPDLCLFIQFPMKSALLHTSLNPTYRHSPKSRIRISAVDRFHVSCCGFCVDIQLIPCDLLCLIHIFFFLRHPIHMLWREGKSFWRNGQTFIGLCKSHFRFHCLNIQYQFCAFP